MAPRVSIVVASRNPGKVEELKSLLAGAPFDLVAPDAGGLPVVEETAATYVDNAMMKARSAATHTGGWALGDDSGLEVDLLKGAPGIHSARFAGPDADAKANNEKLLELMRRAPPAYRKARFVCVLVLCSPSGETLTAEGECAGRIGMSPRGEAGFGYDPLFLLPDFGKTMAELTHEEKNRMSHRARAAQRLLQLAAARFG